MSNGKGENAEKMDSFEDPSNTSQTIVGEELIAEAKLIAEEKPNEETENKLNEEVEENKNENNKSRSSERDGDKEDKEDLLESKKVKKSPRKKQNQ